MSLGIKHVRKFLPELSAEASRDRTPCLVHLVRAVNSLSRLRAFTEALRARPPGIDYELVFVMKGFDSPEQARPHLEEAADLNPHPLFVSDRDQDTGVFISAATHVPRGRYCFVNSYGVPLVHGWLAKLNAALDLPAVGMVGATGSWVSTPSWMAYSLGLPSAYRSLLPPPSVVRAQLLSIKSEQAIPGPQAHRKAMRERATTLAKLPVQQRFPAYHLRTTAFMVTHETLRRMRLFTGPRKVDNLVLESGREGWTRQVLELGLRALVVDRAGNTFDHCRWDCSLTFHQGNQEDLLVADNRTNSYMSSDTALRSVLSTLSWGSHARPHPAPEPVEVESESRERVRGAVSETSAGVADA